MASICERNGNYRISVTMGRDANGKQIKKTTTFRPDKSLSKKQQLRDAQAYAVKFEQQILNGTSLDGQKTTLKEFTERWLNEHAPFHLQASTIEKYQDEIDKFMPALGHYKLTQLRPHIINNFLASLAMPGARKDGKPGGYAKSSIARTGSVLSSILRTAAEWEIIEKNPCDVLHFGTDSQEGDLKFFTPFEAATFLNYIEEPYITQTKGHSRVDDTGETYTVGDYKSERMVPEQIRILMNMAIYSGLRRGELVALKWSDINFETHSVTVGQAATVLKGKQISKVPKTKKSKREVALPSFIILRLQELRASRELYKQSIGECWNGDDWVFIQSDGRMMNYYTPYKAFKDILKRYNKGKPENEQLPLIPFHGLRHTCATLLIASKKLDVKSIADTLGHEKPSTTLNVYAHALKKCNKDTADAIEDMLKG